MRKSAFAARLLSVSLLVFAFGVAVYRAKVQPVAHDEGIIYNWYIDPGVYHLLFFDPSNHVLFTFMAKLMVRVFGVSEFALRMPSLFGALVYLVSTYLLCRRLFGDGLLLVLSTAMLSLNPEILDFMTAARGYILGLACLTSALYILLRLSELGPFDATNTKWTRGATIAAVILALAVVANLTFVTPVIAVSVSFFALAFLGRAENRRPAGKAIRDFERYFIVPGVVTGLVILWPFAIQVRPHQFDRGLHTVADFLRDAFTSSFLYKWTGDIYSPSLGAAPPLAGSWQSRVLDLGVYGLLPLLFFFVLCGLVFVVFTASGERKTQRAECQLFAGAAIGCVAMIVLLRLGAKVDYPMARFCLSMITLFTISGLLLAREMAFCFPRFHIVWTLTVLIALTVVADYGLSINTKYFRYNAYDVISLDVYRAITNDAKSRNLAKARVGGTWWYEPEMNFFRRRYHADWLSAYDVVDSSFGWKDPNAAAPGEYDYFLFTPANDPSLKGPRVRTIYHDDKTQLTILAIAKP
jgi:uncharacterized membrane protein